MISCPQNAKKKTSVPKEKVHMKNIEDPYYPRILHFNQDLFCVCIINEL